MRTWDVAQGWKELRKLSLTLLLTVLTVSVFASLGFIKSAQAEVGSHKIEAVYFMAFVWWDHDDGIVGPGGEWKFGLRSAVQGYKWSPQINNVISPVEVDFPDQSLNWYITGDTWFTCRGEEWDVDIWLDPVLDYSSTHPVNVAFPGATLNTWHSYYYQEGDVTHYYKYRIENLAPTADSISDMYVTEGDSVSFTAPTVTDPEGDSITDYFWDFGDGTNSTEQNSTHAYTNDGDFTVMFKAKDYFGLWSAEKNATVHVSPVWTQTWGIKTYEIRTRSNSILTDFSFNQPQAEISFTVSGTAGTSGWCEVTVENEFLGGNYIVTVGGAEVTPTVTHPDADHSMMRFEYTHSSKTVTIQGATVIPEFPTWTSILLILILLTVAIVIYKRRLLKTPIY